MYMYLFRTYEKMTTRDFSDYPNQENGNLEEAGYRRGNRLPVRLVVQTQRREKGKKVYTYM